MRVESGMRTRRFTLNLTRLALAASFMLLTGGALAYGVVTVQGFRLRAEGPRPHLAPRPRAPAPPHVVEIEPVPAPTPAATEPPAAPEGPRVPRRRPRAEVPAGRIALLTPPVVPPAPAPAPSPVKAPGLSFGELLMQSEAPPPLEPRNEPEATRLVPKPGRLLVNWAGRRGVSLDVLDLSGQGDGLARIVGHVNRTRLAVEIRRGLIVGKIGDEPVNIWLKGEERADGSIAGHTVSINVAPVKNGYLLRGTLPGHTARLEERKGLLRWYPGCERPLVATAAGVYQGTCTEGRTASVVVPPAIRQLPPLARLVMLALVLTERDPVFDEKDPQLFNARP